MKRIFSTLFLAYIIFLSSCEKKIDFELNESSTVLSVDASIETGEFPFVILTKSLNFFSSVDAKVLSESMIKDAVVRISTEDKTIDLLKHEIILPGNLSFVFYTCDSLNTNQQIRGEPGKSYSLEIKWNDKIYTANTKIPILRKTLDSLWWAKAPETEDTSKKIVLYGRFFDPPEFGNYVRYATKVNREPFYFNRSSVFDDLLVNGTTYDIQIPRAEDRNQSRNLDEDPFFLRGDTITIKFSNIDRATFDFWRTTEFTYRSAGNPFFTPVKIIGNISNGALGYFGGYSNQFKSIIIPPL